MTVDDSEVWCLICFCKGHVSKIYYLSNAWWSIIVWFFKCFCSNFLNNSASTITDCQALKVWNEPAWVYFSFFFWKWSTCKVEKIYMQKLQTFTKIWQIIYSIILVQFIYILEWTTDATIKKVFCKNAVMTFNIKFLETTLWRILKEW